MLCSAMNFIDITISKERFEFLFTSWKSAWEKPFIRPHCYVSGMPTYSMNTSWGKICGCNAEYCRNKTIHIFFNRSLEYIPNTKIICEVGCACDSETSII